MLRDLAQIRRGCVLVTGATGMGKSTTLATMIEEVNRARKAKIVTIEDPIEFVFTHDKSIITQREVGTDTRTLPGRAARSALRQDPDVIMVGEMRDHETVDTSLKAAETGHLVFSSIHTADVVVDDQPAGLVLPARGAAPGARAASRTTCARSSRCACCRTRRSTARVPAVEVMREHAQHPGVHQGPRARRTRSPTTSRARRAEGMQTFDQHLLDLLRANKISVETALAAASNPTDFQTKLALEGGDPDDRGAVRAGARADGARVGRAVLGGRHDPT